MNRAFIDFLERHGLKMDWRVRGSYLVRLLSPIFAVGLLVMLLLVLNPQSNRFVYIFQSMVTSRGGPHPWGEAGPAPPTNYTGIWYRWHSNGKLSFEEHYANGQLNGPFRAWDRSGRQWLETAYRIGQYHGDYIWFNEDGTTNRIQHFFEGKRIGRWLHFYPDGKKWEEAFFSEPDLLDGQEILWDTNGAVKYSCTWHKGKPWDGRFTLRDGTNWVENQYDAGTMVSSTNLGPYYGVPYGGWPAMNPETNGNISKVISR